MLLSIIHYTKKLDKIPDFCVSPIEKILLLNHIKKVFAYIYNHKNIYTNYYYFQKTS